MGGQSSTSAILAPPLPTVQDGILKRVSCTKCSKWFGSTQGLGSHMRKKHDDDTTSSPGSLTRFLTDHRSKPEQPATSSFWQQLDEFTSVLDGGDTSSAVPKPITNHGSPRAQSESPPARLPSPGSTETIRWRPHRRTQQRSQRVPYTWPTAPRVTLVAQGS